MPPPGAARTARSLTPIVLLAALSLLPADPAGAQQRWRADDARLTLRLYATLLRDLGVSLRPAPPRSGNLLTAELTGRAAAPSDGLLFDTTDSGVYRRLRGGSLSFTAGSGLTLRADTPAGVTPLPLDALRLTPGARAGELLLGTADGAPLFRLDRMHHRFDADAGRLAFEHVDLRLSAALADRLGRPRFAGAVLGSATLRATAEPSSAGPATARSGVVGTGEEFPRCEGRAPNYRVNFNGDPADDLPVDIALTDIDHVGCTVCRGERINIVPAMALANVGVADVPWFWRLTGPTPPGREPARENTDFQRYGGFLDNGHGGWVPAFGRQHPYLVWALYRIGADGALTMLGRSAVKHAFNAINVNCPCGEGKVFWAGCEDIYGVNTNSDPAVLAPRDEIDAAVGVWRATPSHFDRDGDGGFDADDGLPGADDPLYEQLSVSDAALATPGRYFVEAWYLAAGDVNLTNSIGHLEIVPLRDDGLWTFARLGDLRPGPAIDSWVDPDRAPPGARHRRLCDGRRRLARCDGFTSTDDDDTAGNLQFAVRSEALGGGRYRYRYALMNLDYDRRIDRLSLPLPAGVTVDALFFADADDDPANDWTARRGGGRLVWSVPDGQPGAALDWGTLYAFGFVADAPPGPAGGELRAADGGALPAGATLAPAVAAGEVFDDGFEPPSGHAAPAD